jgi:hypothetical protein
MAIQSHVPLLVLGLLPMLGACREEPAEDKAQTPADGPSETQDSGEPEDTETPTGDTATGDTGSTPAVPYFEPYYVHFSTFFAYDPATSTARWYWAGGNNVTPQIVGMLFETGFLFTGDYAEDACGFTIADADTSSALQSEAWAVDLGGAPGEHLGFVMPPGTFVVGDYEDPETGMPSCRLRAFDPATFGASFAEWASSRRWGFGMGELHSATRERLETDPDFAALGAQLAAGQIIGGSVQTDDGAQDPGAREASLILVGYPMDNTGMYDSAISLGADEMWPESHIPAQGVYTGFLPTWIRTDTLFGP